MVADLLQQDHEQLSELLHRLKSDLRQHDARHAFASLDLFWARLAVHIRAENLCLFPAILNAPLEVFCPGSGVPTFDETQTLVEELRSDHNFFMDELSNAIKAFRELLDSAQSRDRVADQLERIRKKLDAVELRLESHNLLEEDQVYKLPGLILSASDLQNLRAALKRELENLPPRFAVQ